jgi:hypothetical protein
MAFLVIPNQVGTTTAVVWVAAINEQLDTATAFLTFGGLQQSLRADWINFTTSDQKNRIQYQRVTLTNLAPGTTILLDFRAAGQSKAQATVSTLPARLPVKGERPFTVLLGSCYYEREDKAGAVGKTYVRLPPDARPHLKILCGDQIYLDNPPQDFIIPRGHDWLRARSFKTYSDTWTQSAFGGGFNDLLKNGANFFSSDDHEFWNNAPDRGLNVPVFTLTQGQRETWLGIARELYQIFQTAPRPPAIFKVGILGFCIAETRFFRERAHGNFMQPQDLAAIRTWIDDLDGPGVLVVGQPVFAEAGNSKDWGLPGFQQYPALLEHLRASKHSIAIFTGDVHFGRIASATLRPELGTKLFEIISSPLQLVPFASGKFSPAPQVFGKVHSENEFSFGQNHFLTIEFSAPSASGASMVIKFWPIAKNGLLHPHTLTDQPIKLI